MERTSLVERLPDGPLDVIGDVHGEADALRALLVRLGADPELGRATRPIVFVGDLVDRGPDTPAVLRIVRRLMDAGNAFMVLGNHELNTLRGDVKPGSSWVFYDRHPYSSPGVGRDRFLAGESPGASRVSLDERTELLAWLDEQPIVLERDDLRVVHACWTPELAHNLPKAGAHVSARTAWDRFDDRLDDRYQHIIAAARDERRAHSGLRDPDRRVEERLANHIDLTVLEHVENPVRGMVCGLENEVAPEKYRFINGKWRLTERTPWWKEYEGNTPILIGHYWRRRDSLCGPRDAKPHPWDAYGLDGWSEHGNVYCLDFSVGYRFKERKRGHSGRSCLGLAALRWPEKVLVFDDLDEVIPLRPAVS